MRRTAEPTSPIPTAFHVVESPTRIVTWISDSPNPRYRPHHVKVTTAWCPNGVNAFISAIDPKFTVFRWTAPYGMVGGVFEPVLDVLPWPYTRKGVGA